MDTLICVIRRDYAKKTVNLTTTFVLSSKTGLELKVVGKINMTILILFVFARKPGYQVSNSVYGWGTRYYEISSEPLEST